MQQLAFWKLESLTDAALIGGLTELVGSSRQVLARLIAHLGEVEDRGLHLDVGYGSMFSYCVKRLGLSADEAYRRIEVSRLARRYPGIFPRLASGQLTLSVVALLKPHLTETSADELLDLVSGSSVDRAREQLAARFPRPDVPAVIRKLPEPRSSEPSGSSDGTSTSTFTNTAIERSRQPALGPHHDRGGLFPPSCKDVGTASGSPNVEIGASRATGPFVGARAPEKSRRVIEPLSKGRYKIQLTADDELKGKLELARDLMRHTQPDGDLAPILGRALDLLIEQIMKRRFGARSSRRVPQPKGATTRQGQTAAARASRAGARAHEPHTQDVSTRKPRAGGTIVLETVVHERHGSNGAPPTIQGTRAQDPMTFGASSSVPPQTAESHRTASSRTIPRATLRVVAERDGLRCSWQGPDGTRCDARAWLENDHHHPRGRGGDASPENMRLLCWAHNQRSAEKEYGRQHIDASIARARRKKRRKNPASDTHTGSPKENAPNHPPMEKHR